MNDELEQQLREGLHRGSLPPAPDSLREGLAQLPSQPRGRRLTSVWTACGWPPWPPRQRLPWPSCWSSERCPGQPARARQLPGGRGAGRLCQPQPRRVACAHQPAIERPAQPDPDRHSGAQSVGRPIHARELQLRRPDDPAGDDERSDQDHRCPGGHPLRLRPDRVRVRRRGPAQADRGRGPSTVRRRRQRAAGPGRRLRVPDLEAVRRQRLPDLHRAELVLTRLSEPDRAGQQRRLRGLRQLGGRPQPPGLLLDLHPDRPDPDRDRPPGALSPGRAQPC